jgi:hypothetical protein
MADIGYIILVRNKKASPDILKLARENNQVIIQRSLKPKGDIAGVLSLMVSSNPTINFTYQHKTGKGTYLFTSKEIKQILEDVQVSDPKVVKFMREMIQDNLNEINATII